MKQLLYITLFLSGLTFAQKSSILWQAEKDDVKIYLLGSNHLYPADSILHKEKINALIIQSDLYIDELDSKNDNRDSIFNSRKDNQIEKNLGKKDFKIYTNLFPDDQFTTKLSPAEINVKLERKKISISCGSDNKQTMDAYFDKQVEQANIETFGFEKVIDQLNQLSNLYNISDKMMWEKNRNALSQISDKKMKSKCIDQALITKNTFMYDFEKEIPANQKQFWDDRNIRWIGIIDEILAKNKYKNIFIRVGIGHLNYSKGLIMLLKNKGYQLTPVIF